MICAEYQQFLAILPSDAVRILEHTRQITGKEFEIRKERTGLSDVWASVKIADSNVPAHVVTYDPARERYLGYLVGHECGHVIRIYGVPAEERKLPFVSRPHRLAAAYDLRDELVNLTRRGMPASEVSTLLAMWHGGIVRQLANTPSDLRIERWLYQDYQGLRAIQETALAHQMRINKKGLLRQVRRVTPEKLYFANNVMNAGFARFLSLLLNKSSYFDVYRETPFATLGENLGDETWETPDKGYGEDIGVIERWSRLFDLDAWWEWRPI